MKRSEEKGLVRNRILLVVLVMLLVGTKFGEMTASAMGLVNVAGVTKAVQETLNSTSIEKECKANNISYTFVTAVMNVDNSYDPKVVSELAGYFKNQGDDPYVVLLCHHYGVDKAKSMTNNFQDEYTPDDYVTKVFAAEKELIAKSEGV